jgi:adenylylsulfate kinase-like enzyme
VEAVLSTNSTAGSRSPGDTSELGDRTRRAQPVGTVWWLTGLGGAGKTTLGRLLTERLRALGRSTVFLDGDRLRADLFPDAGYAPAERLALAHRYGGLCGLLADQGHDVVCATISLYPEVWEANRRRFAVYREVFVHAPLEVLAQRKPALYEAEGPVVGRERPALEPPEPHMRLLNDGGRTPVELVDELLSCLLDEAPRR